MVDKQHFLATAYGKGACDKVWGTIKSLARKASLQKNLLRSTIMTL
jgi:hypothetical protein